MSKTTIPQKFVFNDQEIDFELTDGNVMVNATQMAKIFNKEVTHFLENVNTEKFINACLKTRNSEFLNIQKREDLVFGRQKSGTWMHRILALKFAAWLNPEFELWVYCAIDEILFGHFRELESMLRRSAENRNRIEFLRDQLRTDPLFSELEGLELLEKQTQRLRARKTNDQLELFRILTVTGNE